MAKTSKIRCDRCEAKIAAGVSFCGRCGGPTRWASHDERVSWEVSQWNNADRTQAAGTPSHTGSARGWIPRQFGRKAAPQPTLTLVRRKPQRRAEASSPAPAETAETAAIAPASPKPEPARASVKPITRPQPVPTPKIKPSPLDDEALRDTPATVMAMRLLNARVAELDAKVQRLERALAEEQVISLP